MSLPDTISTADFAALAGRSKRRIEQLAAGGVLPKIERGKLPMPAAMHALLAHIEAGAERAAERQARGDRVREARAREIELRISEREGKLIAFTEACEIMDALAAADRAGFAGLAAKITRDVPLRRKIQSAVDDAQARVAAIYQRWHDERTGAAPPVPRRGRRS